MKQVRGTDLRFDVQREALARFVHRMTRETVARFPDFAAYMFRNGYRMPIVSDREWLERTLFWVRDDGRLSNRHRYCQTDR